VVGIGEVHASLIASGNAALTIDGGVSLLGPCPADFADANGDHTVGFADFVALLGAWNSDSGDPTPPWNPAVDFDSSGTIGNGDFLALLAHWQSTCV
jgi:hypothetical protein